jgi:hypothetical protein
VKYEKAPFDRPEIFVPIDGTAPENTFGSRLSGQSLIALSLALMRSRFVGPDRVGWM